MSEGRDSGASRARGAAPGVIIVIAGALLLLASILLLNGGRFTYTLDDPYIHLALAEAIRGGHYGINAGEASAPSSSILWPFLLAPLAGTPIALYEPLILSLLAAAGCAVVMQRVLVRTLRSDTEPLPRRAEAALLFLVLLSTNTIGLPFTGMEHSLQVLFAVGIFLGMLHELESRRAPTWLLPAIAIAPLIRYENLAVSAAALLFLFLRGHRLRSLLGAFATLVPLGLFSVFLLAQGLEPLPASVLIKEPLLNAGGGLGDLIEAAARNLRNPTAVLLTAGMLWFLSVAFLSSRDAGERRLAGAIALAVALHLVAGRYGWYWRYEIYVVSFGLLGLLYLNRKAIAGAARQGRPALLAGMAVLWCGVIGGRYVVALPTVPLAANNVYEQHFQMHRFVTAHYRGAVAVHDLGYVSYGNDQYVLDLGGLALPYARTHSRSAGETTWMNDAAKRHGVGLAMLYEDWFDALPSNWRKLGELRLGKWRITPARGTVAFYALNDSAYARGRGALEAFRRTLPPGVVFEFSR